MELLNFFKEKNTVDEVIESNNLSNSDKIWVYNVINDSFSILNYIKEETYGIRFKEKTRSRLKKALDTILLLEEIETELFGTDEYKKLLTSKEFFENMAVDYLSLLDISHEQDSYNIQSKEDEKFFKSFKGKSFNLTPSSNMTDIKDRQNGFIAKNNPIKDSNVYPLIYHSLRKALNKNITNQFMHYIFNKNSENWEYKKPIYDYISINGHSLFEEGANYPNSTTNKKYFISDTHYWSI